jgi:hypothetical protein
MEREERDGREDEVCCSSEEEITGAKSEDGR